MKLAVHLGVIILFVKDFTNTNYIQLMTNHTVQDAITEFLNKKQDICCVMEDGQLKGLVTKSRIYRSVLEDPTLQTPLKNIMKEQIVTVLTTTSAENAKDLLVQENVGHAIVLTEQYQVYGVLTTADLIQMFLTGYQNLTNYMHTLIENIHDAIITVNTSLQITGFNKATIDIYPFLQKNFMHAPITAIDGILEEPLLEVIHKNEPLDQIISIHNRKFVTTFIPLIEHDRLVGAMTMFRDITAIEAISAELASTKKLEKMIDMALELSFDAILIVNSSGKIIRTNTGFHSLFNVPKNGVILADIAPEIAKQIQKKDSIELLKINNKTCLVTCKQLIDGNHVFGTLITIMSEQLSIWKNVLDHIEVIEQNVPLLKSTMADLDAVNSPFNQIISISMHMNQLKKEALIASDSHLPIFITGENGTGKSMIAKCIHEASKRKGNFITVNCAAIPQELIEAEFFGYADGAFTGAKRGGKPGKFELADQGTLFLDEIGDMPLSLQAKLLRVLQDQEFERLGDTKTRKVNVRIITATNKNIEELVEKKLFREDLYYRIHVIHLHMPSLKERKDDISFLAENFLQRIIRRDKKEIVSFTPEAMQLLTAFTWPGNVRQLENIIERSIHFCDGRFIQKHHLPRELQTIAIEEKQVVTRKGLHDDLDKKLLIDTLQQCHGNKSQTAKQLGISRTALYNKLKQYDIHEQTILASSKFN